MRRVYGILQPETNSELDRLRVDCEYLATVSPMRQAAKSLARTQKNMTVVQDLKRTSSEQQRDDEMVA